MILTASKRYSTLGSIYDGKGVYFSLFSEHAEKVELCVFDDQHQETRLFMPAREGNIWYGYLIGAKPGLYYNYRVYGPNNPEQGFVFNANRLLIDPYAKALSGDVYDHPALYDGEQDNAAFIPKSVVVDDPYDWQQDRPPAHEWGATIIYEAHVKGLTQLHPDLPPDIRGSYAALGHPVMLAYFKKLGITAIELLPIQQHIDEPRLQKLGLRNYWGYNVIAPFSIEPRYGSKQPGSNPRKEFKDAVKALHQADIEVILDVVFNHTAELDDACPILSLKGIDKKNYYWLDDQGVPKNWTGCGNTLKLTKAEVIEWVLDCLRYWVSEFHVDGFRFDLGTVLGRSPDFSPEASFLNALRQDPILKSVKLIAEPWDIGNGGYQFGNFPSPFAEWNDRFREDMRRFWLIGGVNLGQFAQRFAASSQIFEKSHRRPNASINFLTCHDGFTLHDLLSFEQKHNEANGEQNHDGNNTNWSNNHGIEGNAASDSIKQLRKIRASQLLALLLLSQGTPMLMAGDEWGNSQQGNNNGYCQDNEISWLNWEDFDHDLYDFCIQLIALRKKIPALQVNQWWTTNQDVRWLNAEAKPLTVQEWESPNSLILQIELSEKWLILINNSTEKIKFKLKPENWRNAICSHVNVGCQPEFDEHTNIKKVEWTYCWLPSKAIGLLAADRG